MIPRVPALAIERALALFFAPMALVMCPDCQRQVSDAAPACPGCGRPFMGAANPMPVPFQNAPLVQTVGAGAKYKWGGCLIACLGMVLGVVTMAAWNTSLGFAVLGFGVILFMYGRSLDG